MTVRRSLGSIRSAENARGIALGVASKMTGEELGLKKREPANADLGVEYRVNHFFTLSFDERLHNGPAAVGRQLDRAAVALAEVGRPKLLTVNQGEHEAIRDQGAELLDKVEREAW